MNRAALFALLALAAAGAIPHAAQAAQETPPGVRIIEETELERQTRAVASQLRCVVCQGLSIEDSPSQLAQEMRAVVREQLAAGASPDQVRRYFVDKYGEWVLLQPNPAGFNLLVYVLPIGMLLGGVVFVFATARKWTRRPGETVAPPE